MKRKAVAAGRTSSEITTGVELTAPYDAAHAKRSSRSSKKMSSNGAKAATAKRKSGRATKKNPWSDEDFVTTSDKSPLIDIDLAKLLAKPEAWTCLDEAEKKEILALLPESVHPVHEPSAENPDGIIPPLSEEFLRYSNVWRDATRQFQVDLQNGKFDPQWLSQAQKAREEREAGKFDARKERDFEAFWGQKQRYHTDAPAGDSATVSFQTLVADGVFEVGDVWKYSRASGKGAKKILVEKEVAVVSVDGKTLTFAIPPGRRVMLSSTTRDQPETHAKLEAKQEAGPKVEPEHKAEHKADPEESASKEKTKSVSPKPRIHDEEKRSVAQEYIEANNQAGFTSEFIAELNQIAASEDQRNTKTIAGNSLPILADIKSAATTHSPMDIEAPETTLPELEPDATNEPDAVYIDIEPTTETAIPNSADTKSAPTTQSLMDIDVPGTTPPVVEPDSSEKPNNVNGQELAGNLISEDSEDDSCSSLSDPPNVIEEIDDEDFHNSLQELGYAPPKGVPSYTRPCVPNAQPVIQPTEPDMVVVEDQKVSAPCITIAAQPADPSSEVPNDTITLPPGGDGRSPAELEPPAAEVPDDTNHCPPTEPTPPVTEVQYRNNTCPSNTQTALHPETPHLVMGGDVNDCASNPPMDLQVPEPGSMESDKPNTCSLNTCDDQPEEPSKALPSRAVDETNTTSSAPQTSVSAGSSSDNQVIFPDVAGPMALSRKIHELDGREVSSRIANAWMLFRCIRNNQDMGTLWEVRHSWYVRSKRG
ncbi:uncharacterized protein GIQ15_00156 [Arthroderma uncinatum]|uniref:uncharacterized protein n=1 Tax=Arthroderma uncinatum TaxID=74035 RepID=UPI00144AEF7E|nr:uncharacterized protein GIQ15_00156 [Arthroderma uncinatum]KAF3490639.1 hypothetical protein GIQ15_00156 [Arthroderma uncinatum]